MLKINKDFKPILEDNSTISSPGGGTINIEYTIEDLDLDGFLELLNKYKS